MCKNYMQIYRTVFKKSEFLSWYVLFGRTLYSQIVVYQSSELNTLFNIKS